MFGLSRNIDSESDFSSCGPLFTFNASLSDCRLTNDGKLPTTAQSFHEKKIPLISLIEECMAEYTVIVIELQAIYYSHQ